MVAVESVLAAFCTAAWALAASKVSVREFAAAFIIAGFAASMFVLKEINTEEKLRFGVVVMLACLLIVYQTLLSLAFTADGARAQAIVNMNVVIITFVTAYFGEPYDKNMIAFNFIYVIIGLYAAGLLHL